MPYTSSPITALTGSATPKAGVSQQAPELLSGEATRVSGDERRGVANAYGPRGTYASCEYQMHTALQGAGACTFSNGAKYQVHIGS